ncbi:MAG: hypothetical protein JWM48_2674 [Mycobacterium sp.]|jgi:hypothetical protein|nr:hypothetical protein [Mycobacterium sp.]
MPRTGDPGARATTDGARGDGHHRGMTPPAPLVVRIPGRVLAGGPLLAVVVGVAAVGLDRPGRLLCAVVAAALLAATGWGLAHRVQLRADEAGVTVGRGAPLPWSAVQAVRRQGQRRARGVELDVDPAAVAAGRSDLVHLPDWVLDVPADELVDRLRAYRAAARA